jgi:hypothetical protein
MARIDGRQQIAIDVALALFAWPVIDAAVVKLLAHPSRAVTITAHSADVVATQGVAELGNGLFGAEGRPNRHWPVQRDAATAASIPYLPGLSLRGCMASLPGPQGGI